IHGLGLAGRIFRNGEEVFSVLTPWSRRETEFNSGTEKIMELVFLIDNRLVPMSTTLFRPNYDFYGYGGIYRSVELETELPEGARFDRAVVETLSLSGRVKVSGVLHGGKTELKAAFDGGTPECVNAEFDGEKFCFEADVPDPALWSPESPALHTIQLQAGNDILIEQFGLRTVKCEAGKILLNGRELRLAGFNRHDAHPQFGPAMPDELWIEDLQLLKELNCNFIRGCHYPQSQRFLDICDRLGFLVWEESLGWGNREAATADPEFIRLQCEQTANMVNVSRNHPCVIFWGFMNESNDHEESGAALLHKLAETVRSIDLSRPVVNATNHVGYSLALKEFDAVCFNVYPAWYEGENPANPRPLERIGEVLDAVIAKLDSDGFADKPLVISEIGAGAIYGWHDRIQGFWSEEYQADYLETVIKYFAAHPRLSGLALWHFADARTYAATPSVLGRPRAFNNKGVLDEYRRPKMSFDRVKGLFADLEK
ncbi:MAG: beta-galactosidase, partial [Lentisphaeria bacterium]|nr:beta-galactosidase [Lentisphaeria bacterium]